MSENMDNISKTHGEIYIKGLIALQARGMYVYVSWILQTQFRFSTPLSYSVVEYKELSLDAFSLSACVSMSLPHAIILSSHDFQLWL